MDPNQIRRGLSYWQKRRGFSTSVLARKSGVSRPGVIAILNGDTQVPKFDTLEKILNALNISQDDLLLALDEDKLADEHYPPSGGEFHTLIARQIINLLEEIKEIQRQQAETLRLFASILESMRSNRQVAANGDGATDGRKEE
jgi:transcriptional regulator with XRE-family HTH domain